MNAQLGDDACIAIQRTIETSFDSNDVWKEKSDDKFQSALRCLQIYSDKLQSLMSVD